nr:hypothetical protein [Microbacterium sp. SORGH_AS_0888]
MTAVPRSVRVSAALVGTAGIVALAGCSASAEAEQPAATSASTPTAISTGPASAGAADAGTGTYKDGTYTASGTYQTPETLETVEVTLTLQDDVVTAVQVTGDPKARESQQYQSQFIGGISDVVVGKKLDEIQVSRVAGSSLTSGGFNKAIAEIKSEATS